MSRRASLTTIVKRSLAGECRLPPGSTLLVAVSGGPDSMALLSVLARVAPGLGLTVVAHGVDHGLRAEAARELDLAEALANRCGVPFERTGVSIRRGGNLQARARDQRWAALVTAARRRGAVIATAHHAEDRAETLLMRLLRGAGRRGLGVIPPRASAPLPSDDLGDPVSVVRPILRARREDVLAHLERNGVSFANDPWNGDPRFLRTVVRARVLPLLVELDPNVVDHLTSLADELVIDEPRGKSAEWARSLPRVTQDALRRLTASQSLDERVWLPGGLVVSLDPRARHARPGKPGKPDGRRAAKLPG